MANINSPFFKKCQEIQGSSNPISNLIILLLMVISGPHFWAKWVLSRYNKDQYFSGSGIELARIILDRLNMPHVRVEVIEQGDHYDPREKVLRLSRNNCGGRKLTAVVVATHEVGHAIQDSKGYFPLQAGALASLLNIWRWIRILRR